MSIDERLRAGLAANTEHLGSGLEREISTVLRRVHRRRQARVVGGTLVVAAIVAAFGWVGGMPGLLRGAPDPAKPPRITIVEPRSMAGMNGPLTAGRWVMPMVGNDSDALPRAVVEVPPGYGTPGGWVVDRGADGDPDNHGEVFFWTAQDVVRDPCEGVTTADPGPTVLDLANAIVAQPGQQTSRPKRVTVDGYSGLYLEVTTPRKPSRLAGCHASEYALWSNEDGDFYRVTIAGTVNRFWILDLDGQRVVMCATTTPSENAAAITEVVGIAESTHFLPPLKPTS